MEMELREGGNTSARLVAKNSSNRMLALFLWYFYTWQQTVRCRA